MTLDGCFIFQHAGKTSVVIPAKAEIHERERGNA